MDAIARLIALTDAYRCATGLKLETLSWRLFGDSKKLRGLLGGADIQVSRYERALSWLSDNWPEGAEWPAGIDRPPPSEPEPAGAPVAPSPSGGGAKAEASL